MLRSLTGQTIKSYVIGERLGEGGLGEVYEATSPSRGKVAMKVLRGPYANDPEFQNRFVREIRIMQAVEHENIVPIYDFGAFEGQLFLVMKYLNGQPLSEYMERRAFTPLQVWRILSQIAPALQAGHDQGVIHRDIKPENILVHKEEDGTSFYLSDFGLAKRPGLDETLTSAGMALGTMEYIAPEMASGNDTIDARSDQYSLGIMIYELLTGQLPFDAHRTHLILMAHIKEPPVPMRERHPDFPKELEKVVLKALSKPKAERYPSVLDFARAYYNVLAGLPPEQQNITFWR